VPADNLFPQSHTRFRPSLHASIRPNRPFLDTRNRS
jgi:hypothetical protein